MPDTFSGTCYWFIREACTKSTLLGYIAAFSVHIAIPVACALRVFGSGCRASHIEIRSQSSNPYGDGYGHERRHRSKRNSFTN